MLHLGSSGSFDKDITKWCVGCADKALDVAKAVAKAGLRQVTGEGPSPIDTGRFRGNWNAAVGEFPNTYFDPLRFAPGGAAVGEHQHRQLYTSPSAQSHGKNVWNVILPGVITIEDPVVRGDAIIDTALLGETIWLSNNVNNAADYGPQGFYGQYLEQGMSPQAPAGVLEPALYWLLANFDAIVTKAVGVP